MSERNRHANCPIHQWHKTHRAENHGPRLDALTPWWTQESARSASSPLSHLDSAVLSAISVFWWANSLGNPWAVPASLFLEQQNTLALLAPYVAELPSCFALGHAGTCILPAPARAEKESAPVPKKTSSKKNEETFFRQLKNGPHLQKKFTQNLFLLAWVTGKSYHQVKHGIN